jgi:hypothetical protein
LNFEIFAIFSKVMWTGYVVGAHSIPMGKLGGNRSLGRHRRRWEDDIKMNLKISPWMVWKWLIWWLRIEGSCGLFVMR